jgi:hypothetical protein
MMNAKTICFRELGIRPGPCHRSCGQLPASHRRGPGSIPCGICGRQSDTVACFGRALKFPSPILILSIVPNSLSFGTGTIGQVVSDVPRGCTLTSLFTYLHIFRLAYFIGSNITCENWPSTDKAAVLILKLCVFKLAEHRKNIPQSNHEGHPLLTQLWFHKYNTTRLVTCYECNNLSRNNRMQMQRNIVIGFATLMIVTNN